MRRALIGGAVLLGGCYVSPGSDGLPCEVDAECDQGQSCVAGECRAGEPADTSGGVTGADDVGDGDSGGDGDGATGDGDGTSGDGTSGDGDGSAGDGDGTSGDGDGSSGDGTSGDGTTGDGDGTTGDGDGTSGDGTTGDGDGTSGDGDGTTGDGDGDGSTCNAPATFIELTSIGLGSEPGGPHFDDVDGDGFIDLLIREQVANELELFWGDGTGAFSPADNLTIALGRSGSEGDVGDVDNDGDADILWGTQDLGAFQFVENLGGGTFAAPVAISHSGGPNDIRLFDYDDDGNLDVYLRLRNSLQIVRLPGNGDGTFGSSELVHPELAAFDVGDVDGDGLGEMIKASSTGIDLFELDGDGLPSASAPFDPSPLANGTAPVLLDVDSDGDLDLYLIDPTAGEVAKYENDGFGNFEGCLIFTYDPATPNEYPQKIGDTNGDGLADYVSVPPGAAHPWMQQP